MKVRNVSVRSYSPERTDRMSALFETEEARYHIWFDSATLRPEPILYKNPLEDSARPTRGVTRRLDGENKTNAAIINSMMALVVQNDLVSKALAAAASETERQADAKRAAHRVHAQREFGPRFYDSLTALVASAREVQPAALSRIDNDLQGALRVIAEYDAAVAEVSSWYSSSTSADQS